MNDPAAQRAADDPTAELKAEVNKIYQAGYRAGLARARDVARDHNCGGPNDFICRGINCLAIVTAELDRLAGEGKR